MNPGLHVVTSREVATILAALRLWQRTVDQNLLPEYIIATDAGQIEPMPTLEVEALCYKINTNTLWVGEEIIQP